MMSGAMALQRIRIIMQSVSSSMICLQLTRRHALQSKVLSAPVSCPTSGSCDTVLSSGYASVVGVPLPLLGMPIHLYLPAYPTLFAQSEIKLAIPIAYGLCFHFDQIF